MGAAAGSRGSSAVVTMLMHTAGAWAILFLCVAGVELVTAAVQGRMSGFLVADGLAVAALGLCYLWEVVALRPLTTDGAEFRAQAARRAGTSDEVYAAGTNVRLPAIVRHAVGRVSVLLLTPVYVLVFATEYAKPTWNRPVDGFSVMVILVRVVAFLWEAAVLPVCRCRTRFRKGGVPLRVLQLNATSCVGVDGKWDITRLGSQLAAQTPDVVALQQVERNATVDADGMPVPLERKNVDAAQELATRLDMQLLYGAPAISDGTRGNALLVSRSWAIESHSNVDLSSWRMHSSTRWAAAAPVSSLVAVLRHKSSAARVVVTSAKFSPDFSGVSQLALMQELCVEALRVARSAVAEAVMPSLPCVVCGDFVSALRSSALAAGQAMGFEDTANLGWAGVGQWGCNATASGGYRPDRVLVTKQGVTVRSTEVVREDEPGAGHHPVLATLSLP